MNELTINAIGTEPTMTLKEITDLLSVQHSKALDKVLKMSQDVDFGPVSILDTTYNSQGQTIETALLNKRQSLAVAAQLNTGLLMRVIDRWQELEQAKPMLPTTYLEALKELVSVTELAQKQAKQIEVKDSLIVASNEASIKAGEILIREFVKSVDIILIGEKQFYQWMRDQKIILHGRNEPYQNYVKAGFFTYKPTEEMYGGKFRYTLRVTPRGKIWLAAKYMAYIDSL